MHVHASVCVCLCCIRETGGGAQILLAHGYDRTQQMEVTVGMKEGAGRRTARPHPSCVSCSDTLCVMADIFLLAQEKQTHRYFRCLRRGIEQC